MNKVGPLAAATAANPINLPPIPQSGTTIQPLMSPDDIYTAELAVINETHPGQELYINQYTLPKQTDGPSVGTAASDAQRQILGAIVNQIKYNNVRVFIIADNEAGKKGEAAHNQDSINYLQQMGAYILPYPSQYVNIDHTKFVANNDYAVVASANESAHQSDSPDDNTGFLFAGAAVHNGIAHTFLPQWNFAVAQDTTGWAANYPAPKIDPQLVPDDKVTWLNTAPGAESGSQSDTTEIKQGYLDLIQKAASGPSNAYLYSEQFDFSNRDVTAALVQAKQANPGLDIRVILDPNMYLEGVANQQKSGKPDGRVTSYNDLVKAGVQVKFANVNPHPPGPEGGYPQIFHDKWMAYNDQEVIDGSGNVSFDSLDGNNPALGPNDLGQDTTDPNKKVYLHNREVDVDVKDAAAAQAFKQKFLNDWTNNASDDPNVAAKGGNNADKPVPTPQPAPQPGGGDNTEQGWGGYMNRLSTYVQGVRALFNFPASAPGSSFPAPSAAWNAPFSPLLPTSLFRIPTLSRTDFMWAPEWTTIRPVREYVSVDSPPDEGILNGSEEFLPQVLTVGDRHGT